MNRLSAIARLGKSFVVSNAPTIFLATGTAGFIATVVSACKAVPKVQEQLAITELSGNRKEDILTIIKISGPTMAPTIGLGVISLACFYSSNHILTKRNAVMAAAASLSERALLEYQEQVVKKLGETAHDDILKAVAEDTDETVFNPVNFLEGDGDTLCYDRVTGRYFMSSPIKIREAESLVVKQCADELTAKLNDFYYELGLDDVSLIGEAMGWDISKIKPDIQFSSKLDDSKRPCLVLNYQVCILNRSAIERIF